jgi:PAS domain S-box-containing protein
MGQETGAKSDRAPSADDEPRARRAAKILGLGYWDADFDDNILFHSPEYAEIHGLPAETVIRRQEEINALMLPEDRESSVARIAEADGLKRDFTIEYRVEKPDGSIAHIREIGEVVRDAAGAPVGHTGIALDVTEERLIRRRLEEALRGAEANLRTRDQFLANMSHELRTPLNAIGGYAEMLTMREALNVSDEKIAEYGALILRSARHLTDVIGDMLTQVELRRQNVEPDLAPIEIRPFLEEMVGIVGLRLEPEANQVAYSVDPPDAVARLDKRLIGQAMINVLGNAVKYAGVEKGITVGYREGDGEARLWVEDQGEGIPADELDRIGEPFFRGARAIRGAIPGTGLGLALVDSIMSVHGGVMEIRSRRGEGTRVDLIFPTKADAGPGASARLET